MALPIDPLSAITTGIGVVETIAGAIAAAKAKKRINILLAQREAYKIPPEIQQMVDMTKSNAQYGYDPQTLKYQTSSVQEAFTGSNATAMRLGGDPNTLSAGFHENINSIIKIGTANHEENLKNVSLFYNALSVKAANEAARQKSEQDIIKDKLQAEGVNMATATGNINSGLNAAMSGLTNAAIMNLYKQKPQKPEEFKPDLWIDPRKDNKLRVDETDQSPQVRRNPRKLKPDELPYNSRGTYT